MTLKTVKNPAVELKNEEILDFIITPMSSLSKCVSLVKEGFMMVSTTSGTPVPAGLTLIARFSDKHKNECLFLKKVTILFQLKYLKLEIYWPSYTFG